MTHVSTKNDTEDRLRTEDAFMTGNFSQLIIYHECSPEQVII